MKRFEVRMTMLVAVSVEVEADSAEQAEKQAMEKTAREEAYYLQHYDSIWEREVTEVSECEDEPDEEWDDLRDALAYVREQLGPDKVAVVKAQVNVCYEQRRPIETDYDDEVHDLLEEWGEEHGHLSEEWWSESVEFQDIIAKI